MSVDIQLFFRRVLIDHYAVKRKFYFNVYDNDKDRMRKKSFYDMLDSS